MKNHLLAVVSWNVAAHRPDSAVVCLPEYPVLRNGNRKKSEFEEKRLHQCSRKFIAFAVDQHSPQVRQDFVFPVCSGQVIPSPITLADIGPPASENLIQAPAAFKLCITFHFRCVYPKIRKAGYFRRADSQYLTYATE